jgi:hypothetical protein
MIEERKKKVKMVPVKIVPNRILGALCEAPPKQCDLHFKMTQSEQSTNDVANKITNVYRYR